MDFELGSFRKPKKPMTVDTFDKKEFEKQEEQEKIKEKIRSGTFDNSLSDIKLEDSEEESNKLSQLELDILHGKI